VNAAFGADVQSVLFHNNTLFARVLNKGIYLSTNSGSSWSQINQGMSSATPALSAMAISRDTLIAAYQSGGIIRRGLPDVGVTGVRHEAKNSVPEGYVLSQNYPNPFNPSTTIEFHIPQQGFVSLKVFDIVGREVLTLVNNELKAGVYRASVDGSGFSSGLYFYRMQTAQYTESKKMLLVK
jgi:hypothetical protein